MFYPSKIIRYCKNSYLNNFLALFYSFSIIFAFNTGFAFENNDVNPVETNYINGWQNSDSSIQGALTFYLKPGFLTYWRNPGPLGLKPHFDWSKSLNIKKVTFDWPIPKIFNKFDTQIIGYEDELILPIRIEPKNTSLPMTLHLELNFGVCSDVCIPVQEILLKIISKQFSREEKQIVRDAIGKVVVSKSNEEIMSNSCEVTKQNNQIIVKTSVDFKTEIHSDTLIFPDYLSNDLNITDLKVTRQRKKLLVTLYLSADMQKQIFERSLIRILVMKPKYEMELLACS